LPGTGSEEGAFSDRRKGGKAEGRKGGRAEGRKGRRAEGQKAIKISNAVKNCHQCFSQYQSLL